MSPILIIVTVLAGVAAFVAVLSLVLALFISKKMFGYRFSHDPLVITYSPEKLGLESVPLEVELGGETVRGAIYSKCSKEKNSDVIVIVCHGMWSSHRSYMQDIGYICDAGYEVIGFDYIGTSLSDGKCLGGFGQSLRCLDAVVRYVKSSEELSKRKIVVYGHSWGGYAATNIVKFHPDIAAVIAVAPATSFEAVAKNMFPRAIHFILPAAKLTDRIRMGKFANQRADKSLEGYSGRVLIIHSEDDPMCPYRSTTGIVKEKFTDDNFTYISVADKGHNPHYTYAGLSLLREYSKTVSSLKTDEEKRNYKKSTDFLAMGELDPDIMDGVVDEIKSVSDN